MENELKPCPFCGSKAEFNGGGFGERFVNCSNDNCGGRLSTGIWFTTNKEAADEWNRRAPSTDNAEAVALQLGNAHDLICGGGVKNTEAGLKIISECIAQLRHR